MSASTNRCDVLVVGAGPVGLFLAGELKRQGVDCRLIEKYSVPCEHARATGIQPRSLEILEQIGLIDHFFPRAVPIRGVRVYAEGSRLIDQASIRDLESPFPFELSLQQSKTEQLLIEYLGRRGQRIERNVELVSFEQDDNHVRAVLRSAGGAEETVEARYLVGCDGSHSTVRHQLGMHLEGMDYPEVYAVADVRIDGPLSSDEVTLYCSPTTGILLAPLPEGRTLFACDLPDGPHAGSQPTLEELQSYLDRAGPGNLTMRDAAWTSYFHCHKRLVRRYQVGRVFLAGDAAHVQSPAAGQGMNTGFQDGFNLAWKLALVLRGAALPSLLDSYHAERHLIGRQMIELSDQTHRRLYDHHPSLGRRLGKWVATVLTRYQRIHPRLRTPDETHVSYHHSPIVRDHQAAHGGEAWQTGPRPGDRAPDGHLLSHPENRTTRLFELIREPRHHLFLLEGQPSSPTRKTLYEQADEIASRYVGLIEPRVILRGTADAGKQVWLDVNGAVHRRYGAEQSCLYLIRPDGYIGYRSPTLDGEALRGYLSEVLVPPAQARRQP